MRSNPEDPISKIRKCNKYANHGNMLTGIGDAKIIPTEIVQLDCTCKGTTYHLTFYLSDKDLTISGKDCCKKLDLIRRVNRISTTSTIIASKHHLMQAYKDIFQGIGQCASKYHFKLNSEAMQSRHKTAKTFPYAKQLKLKKTLGMFENMEIIASVDRPTKWVSNLSSLRREMEHTRVSGSMTTQYSHVKGTPPIPNPDDVQATLAGKRLFTAVHMSDVFWHIKLSVESSYVCTFNTRWGKKRFTPMPFGISSASEVLQQRNDEKFGSIPNVFVIADNLIVAGNKRSMARHYTGYCEWQETSFLIQP